MEWYLNFAHADLFCAYGGRLLAQDELQVAEHPALASLREALISSGIDPFTVAGGSPTPILIRGVERRCKIALDPNADLGRPDGLYGNNFARATPEAIALATQAIEAPDGGYGYYTIDEIDYILITAYTAFSAANSELSADTIVHTGFWSCGAYGGNRVLMALLQLLAARLSNIKRVVFHTGAAAGDRDLATASQILDRFLNTDAPEISVSRLVADIYNLKFRWGVSDGN